MEKIKYPVDVLINYSVAVKRAVYADLGQRGTTLLLGSRYIPLREEFQNIEPKFREAVKTILLTTGGGDFHGMTEALLKKISLHDDLMKMRYFVIVGRMYPDVIQLKELVKGYENISIYQNVANMSEYMLQADMAITAGGSTIYELCACGTPFISFSFADNQENGVQALDRMGIAKYIGDIRKGRERKLEKLLTEMHYLCEHVEDRRAQFEKMRTLVDGKGVQRIVDNILSLKA